MTQMPRLPTTMETVAVARAQKFERMMYETMEALDRRVGKEADKVRALVPREVKEWWIKVKQKEKHALRVAERKKEHDKKVKKAFNKLTPVDRRILGVSLKTIPPFTPVPETAVPEWEE